MATLQVYTRALSRGPRRVACSQLGRWWSVACLRLPESVMFSWSTFGLWWVACAEWLFEPVAAVDGNRFSSNWQWTWFCVCGLEEQRTNSSSSMSPSSWGSSRTKEKCENPPSQPNKKPPKKLTPNNANYEARLPNRLVRTSHTTCCQGKWHDQQSDRTETAIFCLQNDATVRRTVTTFVWPQTQFHENLHTNFVLQNLPITFGQLNSGGLERRNSGKASGPRGWFTVIDLQRNS